MFLLRSTLLFNFCALALTLPSAHAFDQSDVIHVRTVLKTQTTWDGKAIQCPSGQAEITGMIVEGAPGAEIGWHFHVMPSFGMVLEGELEVQLKDGATKHLIAGEALAEVVNTLHNGRNLGSVPVKLIVFYAGQSVKNYQQSQRISNLLNEIPVLLMVGMHIANQLPNLKMFCSFIFAIKLIFFLL